MNALKIVLAAVVFLVGGGVLLLERQSNAQLRDEVALLRSEVQQLAKQRAEVKREEVKATVGVELAHNAQAESDRAELARLRDEMNAMKSRAQEFTQAAQTMKAAMAANNRSPVDSLPVKLTPVSEWKNSGKATPAAAVETVLWSAVGGDVETLANTLEFTASAREKALALMGRLPEAMRAQYDTPEKLLALMIAKDADKVSGMQVLGQKEILPGTVGVRLRFGDLEGRTKEDSLMLHQSADGWRLILNDQPVEKFAKQLSQRQGGGK